jgi:hypothetical protein
VRDIDIRHLSTLTPTLSQGARESL